MLSDEEIKRAEAQVRAYIADGLLVKETSKQHILDVFVKNADESLALAKDILENDKSDLWVVVTSYYAMFYMANAVLYKKGLKVGDTSAHAITANALIVYVRNSLKKSLLEEFADAMNDAQATMKTGNIISSFINERKKRGQFQYSIQASLKKSKAQTSFQRAKDFVFALRKLLQN